MKSILHACCAVLLSSSVFAADDAMIELMSSYCVKCHSGEEPKGDLRLDQRTDDFFGDADRLESIILVLAEKQMPPKKSEQPADELRNAALEFLRSKINQGDEPPRLKRLTREEYTNTVNDLFDAHFDLDELLPPDPAGVGFNKWGEAQQMSPHQIESYLKTARFVADRLLLDERPSQQSWEFTIKNFRGTERGDFQTDTEHVLTTHYPWRSILYFVNVVGQKEQVFRIPEYGRYWIQADATVQFSEKAETVSLSIGDPRYPTSVQKTERAILPPDGTTLFWDATLRAGTDISFTYDSAATWNTGKKQEKYQGRQVRFSKVRITGPISDSWPTIAEQRILRGGTFQPLSPQNTRQFTEHLIDLLLKRPLPDKEVTAIEQLVLHRLKTTGNNKAAARTLLTALLSSPRFIYKQEADTLSDVALAHRLSFFLWNSVPDAELLEVARTGELRSRNTLDTQVERMLKDGRSDRFCEDFTRQWLTTDKIDDIGPDDRVHNKKKVTFMKIRELVREPQAFFRELLHHDLSMVNFIDSDFAMVNDETAAYYGFGEVKGRDFQRVTIPEQSERGGLIGQAGLLKLTSSKHATSPILRGTWILKNIYGEKLAPPPGLAIEEPDIRSAKTVKEVLELHKSTDTCNRCHSRIDPLGLALEHYDEMGLWREQYQHIETEVGNKTVKRRTAPIDSAAMLLDGRTIGSMTDLKAVMLDDQEKIIKAILAKLSSYALGREIGIRDEAMIDEIYDRISERNYSLRAAIHEIVAHEAFSQR